MISPNVHEKYILSFLKPEPLIIFIQVDLLPQKDTQRSVVDRQSHHPGDKSSASMIGSCPFHTRAQITREKILNCVGKPPAFNWRVWK